MRIFNLGVSDFEKVLELGNRIHGDNYMDVARLTQDLDRSIKDGINCSFVAYEDVTDKLMGFRLTNAPGQWEIGDIYSVEKWGIPHNQLCYFRSVAIDPNYRRQGLGRIFLGKSIDTVRLQGGVGGIAHIWAGSPNNSAYLYFTRCGGKVIKRHPEVWAGQHCPTCGGVCTCDGIEMILRFDEE